MSKFAIENINTREHLKQIDSYHAMRAYLVWGVLFYKKNTNMEEKKVIAVWFSCGAASAVAAKKKQ